MVVAFALFAGTSFIIGIGYFVGGNLWQQKVGADAEGTDVNIMQC